MAKLVTETFALSGSTLSEYDKDIIPTKDFSLSSEVEKEEIR